MNYGTSKISAGIIRESCFRPACEWTPPTGDEVRYLIESLNFTQEGISRYLGVTGRTVRRWVSGESPVAYSAWCVLCIDAGLPPIWK